MSVLFIILASSALLILPVLIVLQSIRQDQKGKKRTAPLKTLVVLGSGGHTTEMLHLLQNLDSHHYTPLIYVVATTDTTSERRVEAFGGRAPDTILKIPRSREVGQSYLSSIATTLYSFVFAFVLVLRLRPGLVLCNGPGTCLPIAVVTLFFRMLGLCEGKLIFVESFCRVTSLSLTGRLLYPIVDLFVVHWEQLQKLHPKSHLVSTFVPKSATTK